MAFGLHSMTELDRMKELVYEKRASIFHEYCKSNCLRIYLPISLKSILAC